MCWIGRKNTKQIAKRDFYVYKIGLVIDDTFTNLFQKYLNTLIKMKLLMLKNYGKKNR